MSNVAGGAAAKLVYAVFALQYVPYLYCELYWELYWEPVVLQAVCAAMYVVLKT